MSDQSNDPNEVLARHDPAAMARRMAELEAQLALLTKDNVTRPKFSDNELPRYKLNDPVFFDDTWFDAGTEMTFTDMPNLSMVPLNDAARARMAEHIEHLTEGARSNAEKMGRVFTGLMTDKGVLIAQSLDDARAEARVTVTVPVERGQVPVMPHTDQGLAHAKRGPGRPRKVMDVKAPEAAD